MNLDKKAELHGIVGHVDLVEGDRIAGWAWAPDKPDSQALVEISLNGQIVTVIAANGYRKDLEDGGIGTGRYGFDVRLGTELTASSVTVRNLSAGVNLHVSKERVHVEPEVIGTLEKAERPCVHIYTITFFDVEGRKVYPGGAERYIFDLQSIFDRMGFETRIFQAGISEWERNVFGMKVTALPWNGNILDLSAKFAAETTAGAINIYSPFTLAASNLHRPSIGICHGVYWDINEGITNAQQRLEILSSLKHLDEVVSVDANAINSFRTFAAALLDQIHYIPNYASDSFFTEPKKYPRTGSIKILYPRRLYRPRGYWLTVEVFERLISDGYDVTMWFVGDADAAERKHVQQLQQKYDGRVTWDICSPKEMEQIYKHADITLIPTVNSEGTSLSCLEAMAAGSLVVATNVGGLSNIILNRYNGILVSPSPDSLYDGIKLILERKVDVDLLKRMARGTAEAFSKKYWEESWEAQLSKFEALRKTGGELVSFSPPPHSLPKILHVLTDGIDYAGCALPTQRPHHLMRALARAGAHVYFHADQVQHRPLRPQENVEVLGHAAEVYEESAVMYIYYAYHLWALSDDLDSVFSGLPSDPVQIQRFKNCQIRSRHQVRSRRIWFDLIDLPEIHESKHYVRAVEHFIDKADIVSTSSRCLYERFKQRRPDIVLIENAANPGDFFTSVSAAGLEEWAPRRETDDVFTRLDDALSWANADSRVVCYYGAVSTWFDFALYEHLALKMPEVVFVVAGGVDSRISAKFDHLIQLPNIVYLGTLPYRSLRRLLMKADAAIIPFIQNQITNVTNPVKLFEYLAAGVPVVSTKMDEIEAIAEAGEFEGQLQIGSSKSDFVKKLKSVLIRDKGTVSSSAVIHNSWLARAVTVLDVICKDEAPDVSSIRLNREDCFFASDKSQYLQQFVDSYWGEVTGDGSVLIGARTPVVQAGQSFYISFAFFVPKPCELLLSFGIDMEPLGNLGAHFSDPAVNLAPKNDCQIFTTRSHTKGTRVFLRGRVSRGLQIVSVTLVANENIPLLGRRLDKHLIELRDIRGNIRR